MQNLMYEYRIYPTSVQKEKLDSWIKKCCLLYNVALQQRKDGHRKAKNITYIDQIKELTELRKNDLEYKEVPVHVLQNSLLRLDHAIGAFLARCKKRKTDRNIKAGYPRFKKLFTYRSITNPDSIQYLKNNKLYFPKLDPIKIVLHRRLPKNSKIKSCTIIKKSNEWYCIFCLEIVAKENYKNVSNEVVGIDLGIENFITLSSGETIKYPFFYKKLENKLKRIQRSMSRRKINSGRREKQVTRLSRTHLKIARQREDFHKKISAELTRKYKTIVVENITMGGVLNRKYMRKQIQDCCWKTFIRRLEHSATKAGSDIIKVNPRFTSQLCSNCGKLCKKDIKVRVHECSCGLKIDRDLNAAKNILALGLRQDVPEVTPEERRPTTFRYKRKACHLVESGIVKNESFLQTSQDTDYRTIMQLI